jgi:hypothetical protein
MIIEKAKRVIQDKINDWIDAIESPRMKHLVKNNAIVAGGAIASLLNHEIPRDFDVYLRNEYALENIAQYYDRSSRHKSYYPVYATQNAITLADGIQVILRFHGEPEQITQNFDFLHCKGFYTMWDGEMTIPPESLKVIVNKQLHYVSNKYPIGSLIRMCKFVSRGWSISPEQIIKIALKVNLLDMTDLNVVEEQLRGMYGEGLSDAIRAVHNHQGKIDAACIFGLVEEVLERQASMPRDPFFYF